MSLLEALRTRQRIRTKDVWDTGRLDAAALAVETAFPDYEKTSALSLEQIVSQLEQGVVTWDWERMKVGDVALAIRAITARKAVASEAVREFLKRELEATTNPVFLEAIWDTYLESWQRGGASTLWHSKVIGDRANYLPPARRQCLSDLPELVDADAAPERLAARMALEPDAFQWLVASGIAAPHSGNLMAAAHAAWLTALPEPRTMDSVRGLFYWLFPAGRPVLEGKAAARTIEKLLQPWLATMPPGELKEVILERVMPVYGDPRNQRADFWALVSAPHRKVLIRWLAGESMDALLSIITRSTANHMWPPRHAFWKGLYDRGLIDEAWIALSVAASADARAMFQKTGDPIYTMTSKQVAKSRKDTCLLIMRIGRYTVVEGSHDYRLHVFHSTDPAAPHFYEDEYDAEKLTLAMGHRDTRIHDAYGQWMKWAEERLLR